MARQRTRAHPNGARSLQAAAIRMPVNDANAIRSLIHPPEQWQAEAWGYFDTVPELKFAGWWVGNILSKVRLYAATLDPADPMGAPIPVDDKKSGIPPAVAAQAQAELARLASSTGGHPEILREMSISFDFPGECWLIGWAPRTVTAGESGAQFTITEPERWEVRSIDEVVMKQDARKGEVPLQVKSSPHDKSPRDLTTKDSAIRMWQRHPRWSNLPDSHVRALLGECRSLQVLSQQIMAESMSRLPAGILLVPNGLTFGPPDPTKQGADSQTKTPFAAQLTELLTTPISDPGSAGSVTPGVIMGEADQLQQVRHIHLGRETSDVIDRRIEQRINRIARGLNLPVEVVMGHMSTTFANAEQIDQDSFEDHLEPRVVAMCDMLTFGFLRPNLLDTRTDPAVAARVFVWFDPAGIISDSGSGERAIAAYDRQAIGKASLRAALGFSEEDVPAPDELLLMLVEKKGILTADLSRALLEIGVRRPINVEPLPKAEAEPVDGETPATGPSEEAEMRHLLIAAAQQMGGVAAVLSMIGIDVPTLIRGGADPPALPRGR